MTSAISARVRFNELCLYILSDCLRRIQLLIKGQLFIELCVYENRNQKSAGKRLVEVQDIDV